MPPSSGTSGRRGARAARQALYRTLILDAAETLWAEKGFEATKMEEIAEGLKSALEPDWRGGALARVIEDGEIAVGDEIEVIE